MISRPLVFLAATFLFVSIVHGADLRQLRQGFVREVVPVIKRHCAKCHGTDKSESGLQLTRLDRVLAGGASGAVLQPGKPDESLIVHLIRPGSDPHMPPDGQLGESELKTVVSWIRSLPQDLPVGSERVAAAGEGHWGFQKLRRPAVPNVRDVGRTSTPIDAFSLARLESNGLTMAPPATAGEFIRRAWFDLIGLPPNREDVTAFEQDFERNPDRAVSRLVDRLLASPHYGERWGRHWLDLARYADSNGFEFDFERPHAWHYRDWVINSLNADKPYDEFLAEQIAGDEITPDSFAARVATGFCRNGPTVGNQRLEKHRWDELDDVISTTSEVFLGLTLGCARCHDHKYDPISQRDYYSMLAIFNSV